MFYGVEEVMECLKQQISFNSNGHKKVIPIPYDHVGLHGGSFMQFTGKKAKNGQDIYEGDIRRVEEEGEFGDERYWLACVWIKEWSCFSWLNITNLEYEQYMNNGAEALDKSMFWTYLMEDSEQIVICGDIYSNPEMLKYGYGENYTEN